MCVAGVWGAASCLQTSSSNTGPLLQQHARVLSYVKCVIRATSGPCSTAAYELAAAAPLPASRCCCTVKTCGVCRRCYSRRTHAALLKPSSTRVQIPRVTELPPHLPHPGLPVAAALRCRPVQCERQPLVITHVAVTVMVKLAHQLPHLRGHA